MELKQLINELSNALFEEMCQGCSDDRHYSVSLNTNDGIIEVFYYRTNDKWKIEVCVYQDNDKGVELSNLEKYLEDNIEVDWDAVEEQWQENDMDEWQEHGFRDEADFWHWKEGR